jgi:type VI secretion system protein ImpB
VDGAHEARNPHPYMDGKTGAEELISRVISDPALLKALADARKPAAAASESPNA